MNADPESQSLLAQILLLIVLTLINAFLAASEIAVVSVNKNRVEQKAEEGNVKSQKLLKIIDNPTNFLSTIQVGITLVNILSGLTGRYAIYPLSTRSRWRSCSKKPG